jgi:hypothetical protein
VRLLPLRLCCLVIMFGALVALYLGCAFFVEHVRSGRSQGASLVSGTVVKREFARQWFRPTGPRLIVRIDNSPITVHADLANDAIDALPNHVSFYYDGNPEPEVHLLSEKNLVPDIVVLWMASAFLASLSIFAWRQYRPRIPASIASATNESGLPDDPMRDRLLDG